MSRFRRLFQQLAGLSDETRADHDHQSRVMRSEASLAVSAKAAVLAVILMLGLALSLSIALGSALAEGRVLDSELPGVGITINGKKMCLYSTGMGDDAIVLLSGLGAASPYVDFLPLFNELCEMHRTVVVENF